MKNRNFFAMFLNKLSIIFILLIKLFTNAEYCSENLERICYYSSWSSDSINKIQANLCTIIIYTHAKIKNGILTGENPLIELKKYNNNIKIIIGIGGWVFKISEMNFLLRSKSKRKQFIIEAVKFTRNLKFDGLDLDFYCKFSFFI